MAFTRILVRVVGLRVGILDQVCFHELSPLLQFKHQGVVGMDCVWDSTIHNHLLQHW